MKFYEAVKKAQEAVNHGQGYAQTFQQWKCVHCGEKNTMAEANTFFIAGCCDQCDHMTDLQEEGCGFAIQISRQSRLPL